VPVGACAAITVAHVDCTSRIGRMIRGSNVRKCQVQVQPCDCCLVRRKRKETSKGSRTDSNESPAFGAMGKSIVAEFRAEVEVELVVDGE
jgi:hypothetical protein